MDLTDDDDWEDDYVDFRGLNGYHERFYANGRTKLIAGAPPKPYRMVTDDLIGLAPGEIVIPKRPKRPNPKPPCGKRENLSSLTKAFEAGCRARRAGESLAACPYRAPRGFRRRLYKFTRESAWLRGWGAV